MKLRYVGSAKEQKEMETLVSALALTGNEALDRRLIQQALDDAGIRKATILYDGNTIYPSKGLVAEFKRMRKSGSIEKMSNLMYQFLNLFDIAHYNKMGFIDYYDGSYRNMAVEILSSPMNPRWRTDVDYILKEAGII